MKLAASMLFGGELIHAEECDYDSFKQIMPLCPECKEPVVLVKGGMRTHSTGTPYRVGSFWRHHNSVDEEHRAACELRVNSFTPQVKEAIATQARGQRLELIQRYFWTIWVNYVGVQYESCGLRPTVNQITEFVPPELASAVERWRLIFRSNSQEDYLARLDDLQERERLDIYQLVEIFSKGAVENRDVVLNEFMPEDMEASEIGTVLHRKVSLEAAGFLLSRKADNIRPQSMLIYLMFILRAVCKDKEHFYRPIKEVMNDEYTKFKRFTKASNRGIFYAPEMFIRYFFLQLASIDWRANFTIYLNEERDLLQGPSLWPVAMHKGFG